MGDLAWITWLGWTLVAFGALCVLGWFVRRTAKGSRLCPSCEYDLSATVGLTCPECGKTARSERAVQKRRRRRVWRRLGVLLVVLGLAAVVFNPGRREGWASSVPDWVIWPLMPWTDGRSDAWIAEFEAVRTARITNALSGAGGGSGGDFEDPGRWERLLRTRRFVRDLRASTVPAAPIPVSGAQPPRAMLASGRVVWRYSGGTRELGVSPTRVVDDILDIAEALTTPDERARVVEHVGGFGPITPRAVERLRAMLDTTSPELWRTAFSLLKGAVADGRTLTPEILVGLDVVEGEARPEFVRELYDLVPLDDTVIRRLTALSSEDPDNRVRARAAAVVWRNSSLTNADR